MGSKRFRVAFSFAGEKRDFVSKVAGLLAERFGQEAILVKSLSYNDLRLIIRKRPCISHIFL